MNLKRTFTSKAGVFFVLLIVAVVIFILKSYSDDGLPKKSEEQKSYKSISYVIEGASVLLANGFSEIEAMPGSVSKITTQYFGNEAFGDLNNDGKEDVVFVLTQSGGGSGTFYYIVAALKTDVGYQGTNAVFLGDRIAPQTTEVYGKEVVVNYVERKSDEPMTARPSVGASKYLKVLDGALIEVKK